MQAGPYKVTQASLKAEKKIDVVRSYYLDERESPNVGCFSTKNGWERQEVSETKRGLLSAK